MRQAFLKDNIPRDENPPGLDILDLIVSSSGRIAEQTAGNTPWVKFGTPSNLCTVNSRDLGPTFGSKDTEVSNILPLSSESFQGDTIRMSSGGDKVASVNGKSSSLCPVGMTKASIP